MSGEFSYQILHPVTHFIFGSGMSEVKLKLIPYSAPPSPRVNVAVNIPAAHKFQGHHSN